MTWIEFEAQRTADEDRSRTGIVGQLVPASCSTGMLARVATVAWFNCTGDLQAMCLLEALQRRLAVRAPDPVNGPRIEPPAWRSLSCTNCTAFGATGWVKVNMSGVWEF